MKKITLYDLDPRCKMMMMLCISSLALAFLRPLVLLGILVFTWVILIIGRAELKQFIRQIKPLFYMIISLFIIQCLFTTNGNALLKVGEVTIVTDYGFNMALCVILRLLIITFSALILASGDARDYLLGLVQMKIPYEIAFMVMIAIHFFPILQQEAKDISYAMQMRGTELSKGPLKKRLSSYKSMALPVLSGALRRAQSMSMAMEARAFRLYPTRTYLRKLKLSKVDKTFLILFSCISVFVFILLI